MTGQATQTPDSENARRCQRRAFSSAAVFAEEAVNKLAPDPSAIKVTRSPDPERVLGLLGLLDGANAKPTVSWSAVRGTPSARRHAL